MDFEDHRKKVKLEEDENANPDMDITSKVCFVVLAKDAGENEAKKRKDRKRMQEKNYDYHEELFRKMYSDKTSKTPNKKKRYDKFSPNNNEDDIYNIILNAAKNITTNKEEEYSNGRMDDHQNFYSYSRYTKNKIKAMNLKPIIRRESDLISLVKRDVENGKLIFETKEGSELQDIVLSDARLGKRPFQDVDFSGLATEFDFGESVANKTEEELADLFIGRIKASVAEMKPQLFTAAKH